MLAARQDSDAPTPAELANLRRGFGDFLTRGAASYAQYERDLAWRTRSLATSSAELSAANGLQRSLTILLVEDHPTTRSRPLAYSANGHRTILASDGATAPVAERTAHGFRSSLAGFAATPAVAIAVHPESRARDGSRAGMVTEIAALEREIRTLAGHLRLVAPADSG